MEELKITIRPDVTAYFEGGTAVELHCKVIHCHQEYHFRQVLEYSMFKTDFDRIFEAVKRTVLEYIEKEPY